MLIWSAEPVLDANWIAENTAINAKLAICILPLRIMAQIPSLMNGLWTFWSGETLPLYAFKVAPLDSALTCLAEVRVGIVLGVSHNAAIRASRIDIPVRQGLRSAG